MNKHIKNIFSAKITTDGAGVQLDRLFGSEDISEFNPFLLLDYFESHDPNAISMAFPWHPHRGLESITYVKRGQVNYQDRAGNQGSICSHEIQWISSGSGIIHEEIPAVTSNGLQGFQIWLNSPKDSKMDKPQIHNIHSNEIPVINTPSYSLVLLAGTAKGSLGPIQIPESNILIMDLNLRPERSFELDLTNRESFIFLYEGEIIVEGQSVLPMHVVSLSEGDKVLIRSNNKSRMLIASGIPTGEKICMTSTIAMNSKAELDEAYLELDAGTFIKKD